MSFKIDPNLGANMANAASGALVAGGKAAMDYATHEFQQFAEDVDHIQDMLAAGTISPQDAQYYVNLQKMSMQSVLLTIQGLGVLAVQSAITAALGVLSTAIGAALKVAL
ncbi:MAG: hypothetical protein ABSG50_10360 [Opitutaceae bacterium]|jgi:hypothetical protein